MIDTQANPPRAARALLTILVRPSDAESIPGDLLEEYREVRRPSLGRVRANMWYVRHVVSVLWRVMWPFAVTIVVIRVVFFPVPAGANPSLVPAPGVSLVDALVLAWAGYHGARRTGRIGTGIVIAITTSLVGFVTFCAYALVGAPGLFLAPFEKPFIVVIGSILLLMAAGFGLAAGLVGAAAERWPLSTRKARLT